MSTLVRARPGRPARRDRCNRSTPGKSAGMARTQAPSVAASSEWIDDHGLRQPGGDAHAWLPGTNQTLCGLQLSRSRLRGFAHIRFDFRASDTVTAADEI